jgi:hypothetical protein
MEVPQTGKSGQQASQQSSSLQRLIEEARKAIERLDNLVRRRTLDAMRAQRDK